VATAVGALVLAVVVLALSTAWVWQENQAKNAALVLAKQQREAAEKARGKAMQAVQRMLTRVADEWVADIPQMKTIRRSLLEDAATLYTELINLDPDDARGYHERGWVYYLQGRYDLTRADYERAATMEPDNAEYHGTLATFFSLPIGAFADGRRSLYHARRMVELQPTDARARGNLGLAYQIVGQANEAVAELRKGAELARGTALEHKLLAQAELVAGEVRNAIARLQQAHELPSPDLWVYWRLAETYGDLGEDAQVLATVAQGLELALQHSDNPAEPSQPRARWVTHAGAAAWWPRREAKPAGLQVASGRCS
jgi:tetratricopeptide (TPR) repeat protein